MFEDLGRVGLLETMRDAQRAERAATARKLIAAGRFCLLRMAETADEHAIWCVDDWDVIAAEVAAELGVSRERAATQMQYGMTLIERLPKLAAVFLAGDVDFRVIAAVDHRTGLITDRDVLADIDQELAARVPHWNKHSRKKIAALVDRLVIDLDPEAIRVARQADEDRHIEVQPGPNGLAEVYGRLRAPDAATLDKRLDEVADSVCRNDPRTKAQRRADAVAFVTDGAATMPCNCGSDDCPAATGDREPKSDVTLHVLAGADTVEGRSEEPGYLAGCGTVPAGTVRELAKRAKPRPLVHPKDSPPEPRYRPSAALADFVRCRDLTCRFPGCERPAERADIDHTVPYPHGPTHASNLKLLCRTHHLVKTFYTGPGGWNDRQLPDGTVVWTSPSGRTYTTKPFGALLFPQLAVPTGELVLPTGSAVNLHRGLAMTTRKRSRAEDRAYRVEWERAVNRDRYAADPPPY